MDPGVVEAWLAYREAVGALDLAAEGVPWGEERGDRDERIEELIELSGELGQALRIQLLEARETDDPESLAEVDELEVAAMAAATIDIAVGGEVLERLRREVGNELGDVYIPRAVQEAFPSESERESIEALLERADQDFTGGLRMMGAGPGPPTARESAQHGIDRLVGRAAPLATRFGTGILTTGVSSVLDAVGTFEGVHALTDRIRLRVRYGVRLIKSGVEKLLSFLGSEGLMDVATHLGLEQMVEDFQAGVTSVTEAFWRLVVRAERCENEVDAALEGREVSVAMLELRLEKLCSGFEKKMVWAERVETGIRFLALPALFFLAGGPGHALVAGAHGVALTATLYLLADRLDTLPGGWGRVKGVPKIVGSC